MLESYEWERGMWTRMVEEEGFIDFLFEEETVKRKTVSI